MTALFESLRAAFGVQAVVVTGGFILGMLFGWLAERSQFCLRAAVAEWSSPSGRAAPDKTVQYLAAMLASLIAVQVLWQTGSVDFAKTIYHATPVRLVALAAGGLAFGAGMVLAGGCASRLLVLAASGNLRSWVTLLILAISSYATLRGILAYPRIALEGLTLGSGLPTTFAAIMPYGATGGAVLAGLALVCALVYLAGRVPLRAILFGAGVGLLSCLGWIVTGIGGADEFDPVPVMSLSFTAPVGESVQYLMIHTGDKLRFGIALVAGVMAGAFTSALARGAFKPAGFRSEFSLLRYALGGLLMGFGGVTALGCSMGQGVTGFGTLSIGSVIALAGIIAGARLTIAALAPAADTGALPTEALS